MAWLSHRMLSLVMLPLVVLPVALGEQCPLSAVKACEVLHLLNITVTTGRHVSLGMNSQSVNSDTFCSANVVSFRECVTPFKKDCQGVLAHITGALKYLCGDQRSGWDKYRRCFDTAAADNSENIAHCEAVFSTGEAWLTKDSYTFKSDQVVYQCTVMKEYVNCAQKKITAKCDNDVSLWYQEYIRSSWRPFKEIVTCNIYGPTGGRVGLVVGAVVAAIFVLFCLVAIWSYRKLQAANTGAGGPPSRISTSL